MNTPERTHDPQANVTFLMIALSSTMRRLINALAAHCAELFPDSRRVLGSNLLATLQYTSTPGTFSCTSTSKSI